MTSSGGGRVCIIGLDCLAPELAFDRFAAYMPNLSGLRAAGLWGPLESCLPPITVPAWSVMVTGRDPGTLGVYGFHDRADRSYHKRKLASSLDVQAPTLWGLAGRAGLVSRLIGVPQTFPPKPIKGCLVTDCLTPGPEVTFTYPEELASEVQALTGGYVFDVPGHRGLERDALLAAVHDMTARRFRLARDFIERDDWRLFMMVEMGPDRMHHAFWRYMAADHPAHEPNHRFAPAIRDYYAALDREVGTLLERLRDDDVVLVVSDHGARSMVGGLCLNEWLRARGDLVVLEAPDKPAPLDPLAVDWSRTRAWADGGYVGRIYLNLRGREPEGTLAPDDAGPYLAELGRELCAMRAPDGAPLGTRVFSPREVYREVRGVAPDLLVHAGDLAYRALGTIGHGAIFTRDNDTGPDDANHAMHGVFVMRDGRGFREPEPPLSIYDVAPTVLDRLGVRAPEGLRGRVL